MMKENLLLLNYLIQQLRKDLKLKVGGYVRISKYKNIFVKGHTPRWSEEVFIIIKVKIPHCGHI